MKRKSSANRSGVHTKDQTTLNPDESSQLASRAKANHNAQSVDGTARADLSETRAALHEAVLECTSTQTSKILSSDRSDKIMPLRRPDKPRTATGACPSGEMTDLKNGSVKFYQASDIGHASMLWGRYSLHLASAERLKSYAANLRLISIRLVICPNRWYAFSRPETSSYPLPISFVCCCDSVFFHEST